MTDSKNKPFGQSERPVLDNDPLMELARLSGADSNLLDDGQAHKEAMTAAPEYAADLERELAGELGLSFSLTDAENNSDVGHLADEGDEYSDFLTGEPSFLRRNQDFNQQPVEPKPLAPTAPSLSLEDELANLLFQEEPAISNQTAQEQYIESPAVPQVTEQADAAVPDILFEDDFTAELETSFAVEPSVDALHSVNEAELGEIAQTEPVLDLSDFEFEDFDFAATEEESGEPQTAPQLNSENEADNALFFEEDYAEGLSDALMDEMSFDMDDDLSAVQSVPAEPEVRKEFVPSRLDGSNEAYQAPVFKNPTATSFPFFKPTAKTEADKQEAEGHQASESAVPVHQLAEEPAFQDTTNGYVDPLDFRLNELTFGHDDFAPEASGDVAGYGAIEADSSVNYGNSEHPFDMDAHIARELATQASFEWQASHTPEVADQQIQSDVQDQNIDFDESSFDFSLDENELAGNSASDFGEDFAEEQNTHYENHQNTADAESTPDFLNQYATYAAPEVETVNIGDAVVEQTQSLQLPEVVYEDEKEAGSFNDLETEFSEVFNAIEVEQQKEVASPPPADQAFDDIFSEDFAQYAAAGTVAAAALAAGSTSANARTQGEVTPQGSKSTFEDDFFNDWSADGTNKSVPQNVLDSIKQQKASEAAYPSAQDLGAATAAYQERPVRGRRAMLMATVAGVFVLVGGVAYHFMGGGTSSEEPVIITADSQPIKMQPENPGGESVPNQDKAVYGRVDGTIPQTPQQETLLSDQDEPVDLPIEDDGSSDDLLSLNDTMSGGNDHTIAADDTPPPLVAPHQVQTMVVRPDGSIVPAGATPEAPSVQTTSPQQPSILQIPAQRPEPISNAPSIATIIAPPSEEPAPAPTAPAPSAPAAQPAAPAAANAPIAAGTYMIQVASQPSEELAQKSMANVKQKFGGVLGNRPMEIRKADIPGKGTYYRVRVAGGTKAEANSLCEQFKSAGGSCFVTL